MKKFFRTIIFLFSFLFSVSVSASAEYIDPSAVTYTAQAVAAVVVALGALLTVFRHKIVAFFKKDKAETTKREIHLKEDPEAEKDDTIQ